MRPYISVVTPTFNEAGNVVELHARIKATFATLPEYDYEHLFIDNSSTDGTVEGVKALAALDSRVKLIVNIRNFGHLRSPHHGFLQAKGDAVIVMCSDLQDPPELIAEFLAKWRDGYPVALGVKTKSEESALMYLLRSLYYAALSRLSDVPMIRHATGFGLYDRAVVEMIRQIDDPQPYVRGLLVELGYPIAQVPYLQAARKSGITKNNFYMLYDLGMLGLTSHSKIPLRIAVLTGTLIAIGCFVVSLGYLIAKLVLWDYFPSVGQAPTVIGLFFLSGVQLIFTGILGEYIGNIHSRMLRRPIVIEKERVNFATPEPNA